MEFYQFEQESVMINIDYQLCFMVRVAGSYNACKIFNCKIKDFDRSGTVNANRTNPSSKSGFMFRNNFKYEGL
jgi:hypothetical protein